MPSRRRRGVAAVVAMVLAFALAVGGVVVALNLLSDRPPLVQRCLAAGDGTTAALAPDQTAHAALFAAIAAERGLPARAVTIAIATAMQESKLRNIDYGDRDSLGLFQQRPSQGWGTPEQVQDPVFATHAFYDALVRVPGYETLPVTQAAQAVQRSGFPDAYAQHEGLARLFASALTGGSAAALSCHLAGVDEEATAAMPGALTDLLGRDFDTLVAHEDGQGALVIDVAPLVPDGTAESSSRLAWAVAQWAVATASVTGVSEVSVEGRRWVRSAGADAAWSDIEDHAAAAGAPGAVHVR